MLNSSNSRWPAIALLRSELAIYWPLVAICVVFCAIDIANRVMLNGDKQRASSNRDNAAVSVARSLDLGLYTSYMEKLSNYSDSLTQPPPKSAYDLGAGSQITGARDGSTVWRATHHSYRLVAIFTAGERFAVLQRTHNKTAVSEVIEARIGDNLDGFVIGSMTVRELLATDADGNTADLRLFERLSQDGDDLDL